MELFKRSVYCGHVSQDFVGKEIFLCGWVQGRRDLGGLIFIDLRDRSGIIQLVFNPEKNKQLAEQAHTLRSEFVISVRGTVVERSPESINKKILTGSFEVSILDLSIVSSSPTPPFEIEDDVQACEDLRLKYRYLDLRRPKMHQYIKLRHEVILSVREYLNKLEFYEIETPLLSKSTPEGARDFLVPSRLQKESFYALPQSPQIYKQLLMSAGMEKYFQIARCFRDEDFRSNRQPEFSQLDLEMSFVHEDDVQSVMEGVVETVWRRVFGETIRLPFSHMKYEEAFARFGSDKPDTRFDLEIQDITIVFENTDARFLKKVIDDNGKIGALCVKDQAFSRSALKGWEEKAKKYFGASGLLWVSFKQDGSFDSPVSKLLPEDFFKQIRDVIPTIAPGDTLFIVAGSYQAAWTALGRLRNALGKAFNLIDESKYNFLWVTDFPLLEWYEADKRWYAKHHPFTLPRKGWENQEIAKIKAHAYDLVCNGEELAGGSLRIYDPATQKKIFKLLGISEKEAQDKFGFLLEAQQYGFPPHGGIALGIERLVMALAKTDSIRDVIAFPKTTTGSCLMTQSPSQVDKKQLKELGIKI
ncbi:aspartate--tRNA ligase [Candidatus Dependentiae bacterium]|nr:aspartate--tRNA ligase [Candidatus Dependentiae bacterium]